MKKSFYIFALFFMQAMILSCSTDDVVQQPPANDKESSLKIILNVPVENRQTRGLLDGFGPDEDPAGDESKIEDIYLLIFNKQADNAETFIGKFQPVLYTTGETRIVNAILNKEEFGNKSLTIVILTNLAGLANATDIVNTINGLTAGTTKADVLKSLEYTFAGKWNLATSLLPMWGEVSIAASDMANDAIVKEANLYRGVSKINVVVNMGNPITAEDGITDVFKLKDIRVYYARTSGLAGSLNAPQTNTEGSPTITAPSIPDGVAYFPRYVNNEPATSNDLFLYEATAAGYAIENKIYVPESDQQNTQEPMCLVIGGYYMGSNELTYYRVDFKPGNKGTTYYNAIRNHIYTFNIESVSRPGTKTPDDALDHVVVGMDVTIKDWEPVTIKTAGHSRLIVEVGEWVFQEGVTEAKHIGVESTPAYSWEYNESLTEGDWFTVVPDANGITVTPTGATGVQGNGYVVIMLGHLRKRIILHQLDQFGITVPEEIILEWPQWSSTYDELISRNAQWNTASPGAQWFSMTPNSGPFSNTPQPLNFTALEANGSTEPGSATEERRATLAIQFSNGEMRYILVRQRGNIIGDEEEGLVFYAGDDNNNGRQPLKYVVKRILSTTQTRGDKNELKPSIDANTGLLTIRATNAKLAVWEVVIVVEDPNDATKEIEYTVRVVMHPHERGETCNCNF